MIRILQPGDEALIEQFLAPLADTSMLLLSNLRRGGLVDGGLPLQGTWVGAAPSCKPRRPIARWASAKPATTAW